jgi:uncharacterized delta-60 repeat protein
LNSDGSVDPTFRPDLGRDPRVDSLLAVGDKIVVTGYFYLPGRATAQRVVRLNSDGSIDLSFEHSSLVRGVASAMTADAMGRLYIGAYFDAGSYPKQATVVRLLLDGSIDPTYQCELETTPSFLSAFPDGRVAVVYLPGESKMFGCLDVDGSVLFSERFATEYGSELPRGVAARPDGEFYVGGASTAANSPFRGGAARFSAEGELSASVAQEIRSAEVPEYVIPAPGGKWVVAGRFDYANGYPAPGIARLNSDGTTDTTFNPASLGLPAVADLVTQGDGAILAVGGGQTVARRLLPSGQLDPFFAFNAGTGFGSSAPGNMAVLADGRIAASGWISSYNGETLNTGLIVIGADGARETSFAPIFRTTSLPFNRLVAAPNGGFAFSGDLRLEGFLVGLLWMTPEGSWIYPHSLGQDSSVYGVGFDVSGRLLAARSYAALQRVDGFGTVVPPGPNPALLSVSFSGAALTAQTDNRVLIEGSWRPSGGGITHGPLVRLNADDSLDTTFRLVDLAGTFTPLPRATMQYTDDGRLLVCGGYGVRGGAAINGLAMFKPEALPPLPIITRQPTSINARVGELVTFSVEATGTELSYRWYKDGQARSLGSKLALPSIQSSDFGRYSVEVSGPGSFVMSQTVMLGLSGVAGPRYRLLDYFNPLVVGNQWIYSRTGDTPERTHRRTAVVGLDRSITSYTGGATAHPAVLRVAAFSGAYGVASAGSFAPSSEWTDYYTGHGDRLGIGGSDSAGPLALRFDGSFQLPATMAVGESAITVSDSYHNGVWSGTQTAAYQLIGIESVTTPAGLFGDCLHLRFSLAEDGPWKYEDTWWALGVGIVKSYNCRGTRPAKEEALVSSTVQPVTRPTITTQPASQSIASGTGAALTVVATGASPVTYQWYRAGRPVAGATSATLTVPAFAPADAGIYDVSVTDSGSTLSNPAVVSVLPPAGSQTAGAVTTRPEWQGIVHPKGNIYDQFLLAGNAGTFSAATGRVARMSFLDENESIVQVEMSGAGAITVVLDNASGPMAPALYNQSGIQYMKGKATIILAGADATTHFTIYSVGSATNPGVTRSDVEYAGWADVAAAGIVSTNGGLGGIHQGNVDYNASLGFTGLYAPTVTSVAGLVVIHTIAASVDATPYLYFAPTAQVQVKIAGSALTQPNAVTASPSPA